jgi:hypothetical protein
MSDPAGPRFRTLEHDECVAILARNHVVRIAYEVGCRATQRTDP